jgi:putative MATE family efflux protein
MFFVVLGAVMNIVLDPIFINGFKMGVQGAALATIISQLASAIGILVFLCSKKSLININIKKYKLDFKTIKMISFLGLSPFIMQSTEALIQICFNSQIKYYISDIELQTYYLSSMTIIISIMSLLNMPLQGLAQGTQPIISQNYGAGLVDRSKEASRRLIVYCLVYSFVFVAFLYIFPNAFASLFNDNENILKICEKMIRIMFIGLAFMGIQIGCQNSFLALGKSKISLILAFLRKIILLIPLMYILPLFLGSDGVFISESVADLLAIAITLLCYILLFNKYLKEKF